MDGTEATIKSSIKSIQTVRLSFHHILEMDFVTEVNTTLQNVDGTEATVKSSMKSIQTVM